MISLNYVIANERCIASIQRYPAFVFRKIIALTSFHSPRKMSQNRIQEGYPYVIVDGKSYLPLDSEKKSVIKKCSYEESTDIFSYTWLAGKDIEISERYFLPPDLNVLVSNVELRNKSKVKHSVQFAYLLRPSLQKKAEMEDQMACFLPDYNLVLISRKEEKPVLAFYLEDTHPQCQVGTSSNRDNPLLHLEKGEIPGKLSAGPGDIFVCLGTREKVLLPQKKFKTGIFFAYDETRNKAIGLIEKAKRIGTQTLYLNSKKYWHNWVGHAKKPNFSQFESRIKNKLERAYEQSLIMIKAHQTLSGFIIASHPYYRIYLPHVWLRDSLYSLLALDMAGYHKEAEKGYFPLLKYPYASGRWFPQDQNDSLGFFIHCLYRHQFYTNSSDFFEKVFFHIKKIADALIDLIDPQIGLVWTFTSTHEYQLVETGYEVYTNVTAYRGLIDASQIADKLGKSKFSKRWLEGANTIKENMIEKLVFKNRFAKRITPDGKIDPVSDICIVTPALFGVVEPKHPLAVNSAQEVLDKLWDKKVGGICRYPREKHPPTEKDSEGPWQWYSLWLADYYLLLGDRKKYKRIINWVMKNIPDDSFTISEHVHPESFGTRSYYIQGILPGGPNVISGAEFIRTVLEYSQINNKAS